ncbi:MAG TPA: MBL fold metallo-hydrolase [Candidatus Saccharimonadales bacterium]|nr:MBL fold metallo-hydrolase [Candidatus Saccharimonadales bacterium]
MKITKYEHACVVIEEEGRLLVIDPGKFSTSFKPTENIDCVVITHVHSDHFNLGTLNEIKKLNPTAVFYSVAQVAKEAPSLNIEVVKVGKSYMHGVFRAEFFGGDHELYEGFENVAILVNDTFYHPGDSYTKPNKKIKVLGAPASAPWLRVTEASQFIKDVAPEKVFPIHNSLLSDVGEEIYYRNLAAAAQEAGSEWMVLKPGESIEI